MVWGWPSSKRAVLIFDVEEQLDDVDVDLEGSEALVLLVVSTGIG
jgi:hypothetical protein